jgi:hypothetical protein
VADARPPWVDADTEAPDTKNFSSAELFVAGALSTMPPFDVYHPGWALPFAAEALRALSLWMPDEAETTRINDLINDACDDPWHKTPLRKRAKLCPTCEARGHLPAERDVDTRGKL